MAGRATTWTAASQRVLSCLIAISVVVAVAPDRSAATSSGLRFTGVHGTAAWDTDGAHRDAVLSAVRDQLHPQMFRSSVRWNLIESTPGVYDWSAPDGALSVLDTAQIEPLVVIGGSPPWANGVPSSTAMQWWYVPTDPAQFATWVNQYNEFVGLLVDRYKSVVDYWEIWNEPNEHFFWKPAPNVDQYAQFYATIRQTIVAHDAGAHVAPGGLSGLTSTNPGDYTGRDFLQLLIDRDVPLDNVAVHPYPSDYRSPLEHGAGNNFDDIAAVHAVLVQNGRDVPMWATEFGWPSDDVGVATQADYVQDALDRIRTEYTYVQIAIVFSDYDRPGLSHGLLDSALRVKPAGVVFAAFVDSVSPVPSTTPATGPATATTATATVTTTPASIPGQSTTATTSEPQAALPGADLAGDLRRSAPLLVALAAALLVAVYTAHGRRWLRRR